MNNDTKEKLAIAYAQAKLMQAQDSSDLSEEEIRSFLKAYYFALYELTIIDDSLDEHF